MFSDFRRRGREVSSSILVILIGFPTIFTDRFLYLQPEQTYAGQELAIGHDFIDRVNRAARKTGLLKNFAPLSDRFLTDLDFQERDQFFKVLGSKFIGRKFFMLDQILTSDSLAKNLPRLLFPTGMII
jgi:hypothetical protein